MKKPVYEYVTCPECQREAYISMMNAGLYWLADTLWKCPYCRSTNDTVSLQEFTEKQCAK